VICLSASVSGILVPAWSVYSTSKTLGINIGVSYYTNNVYNRANGSVVFGKHISSTVALIFSRCKKHGRVQLMQLA
jgi:hypothetical protein